MVLSEFYSFLSKTVLYIYLCEFETRRCAELRR